MRSIGTFFMIVSLALCAASYALYVRDRDFIEFDFAGNRWELICEHQQLWLDNRPQIRREYEHEKSIGDWGLANANALISRSRILNEQIRDYDPSQLQIAMRRELEDLHTAMTESICHANQALMLSRQMASPYIERGLSWRILMNIFAVAPALWVCEKLYGMVRVQRRRLSNCCLNCGYDLRATTDRCPECGTIVSVVLAKKGFGFAG